MIDRSHCPHFFTVNAQSYLTLDWKEKQAFASLQSSLLVMFMLIWKVNMWTLTQHQFGTVTKWHFILIKLLLRATFVICPLYIPRFFIRQPSGQCVGHKGVWLGGVKRMGEGWVSVFRGEVRGYGPLTIHVKAWLTDPASSEWESAASFLQSALIAHLG